MPVITLTADGKKKYIPLNENGEFFLTELRGIVSFDDIKEAERLAAGDMSDRSREVCCDINSIGEYDKINGLWEFSGGVARCMENCGRAAAESAFFHRWVSLNKKSGYLKNRLAAGETLTAKNSGLAAEFTKTARETVLAGLSDEPVWDYIMGAIKSGYIPAENLRKMAEHKLLRGDSPDGAAAGLCCCTGDEETERFIYSEMSRFYVCCELWQESVLGYFRLLYEEGRISKEEYMLRGGEWCYSCGFLSEDEFYSEHLSRRTLRLTKAYRDMAREQLRVIYRFFGVPEKV